MKKLFFILISFSFIGCKLFTHHTSQKKEIERKWTIFLYMCGDNNLESAALEDIYEMETSNLNTDEVTVVFLLDRNPAYNSSNDNWSGTRLYKLNTGRSSSQKKIISTEIKCEELSLFPGKETELDMADGYTLSNAMEAVFTKYPATQYGLIMWGHGNGWKNDCTDTTNRYKGFAYDETSNNYLALKDFGLALQRSSQSYQLDFLGFDTCYGAELEVMYEIRNYAKYACGSEGLIPNSGWNYNSLFTEFQLYENKDTADLLECVYSQFSNQYTGSQRASFCVCDLEHIESYFLSFDSFMKTCGDLIKNSKTRDEIFSLIYASPASVVEKYTYGKEGYDIYFDCNSLCNQLCDYYANEELYLKFMDFLQASDSCILSSWTSDGESGGIGVYFQTLSSGGLINTNFNSNYIRGKTLNQIDFVCDSKGYVPSVQQTESFLDKIFYAEF